jgi:predicted  nucleic acid-binding Zn-ribbon protein
MRSLIVMVRRRWLLPVLEAVERVDERLVNMEARLGEIEARLSRLEVDVAAEAESLAERVNDERRRQARLVDEVAELRDRLAGS